MSLVVSVAILVQEGEATHVSVLRGESVIPATPGLEQQDTLDLIDLIRAALDRLGADASQVADEQIVQLRGLLEAAG